MNTALTIIGLAMFIFMELKAQQEEHEKTIEEEIYKCI